MKITKQTTVELDFEEHTILEKAEDILSRICNAIDQCADCPGCPMYGICSRMNGITPQKVLQHAIINLYIEE